MIVGDMIVDLIGIGMIETIDGMIIEETDLEIIEETDLETETIEGMTETIEEMIIEEMIALLAMKKMIVETIAIAVDSVFSLEKNLNFKTQKDLISSLFPVSTLNNHTSHLHMTMLQKPTFVSSQ